MEIGFQSGKPRPVWFFEVPLRLNLCFSLRHINRLPFRGSLPIAGLQCSAWVALVGISPYTVLVGAEQAQHARPQRESGVA